MPHIEKPTAGNQLGALRLLANRDLALFLTSRFLATFSLRVATVALSWQLYEMTRSAVSLGELGLASLVPSVVLLLPSGAIADRFDRRLVVGLSFLLMACCTVSFTVLASMSVHATWPYYAAAASLAAAMALYRPSASSMLPALVGRDQLIAAFSWSSSAVKIGTLSDAQRNQSWSSSSASRSPAAPSGARGRFDPGCRFPVSKPGPAVARQTRLPITAFTFMGDPLLL